MKVAEIMRFALAFDEPAVVVKNHYALAPICLARRLGAGLERSASIQHQVPGRRLLSDLSTPLIPLSSRLCILAAWSCLKALHASRPPWTTPWQQAANALLRLSWAARQCPSERFPDPCFRRQTPLSVQLPAFPFHQPAVSLLPLALHRRRRSFRLWNSMSTSARPSLA